MDTPVIPPPTCRFCSFYHSEGRRGGTCEKLNVPVRGFWRACSLAVAPTRADSLPSSLQTAVPPITTSLFFFEDDPEAML